MSYTIVQSTKFFKLQDKQGNQLFAYGLVAESNNVSPKRYDSISFQRVGKCAGDLAMYLIEEVNHILQGMLWLKNPDGKGRDAEVDTFIRRYMRNLNKAKLVPVEQITYSEDGKRAYIVFGEEGKATLKSYEPKFYFYEETIEGKFPIMLHEFAQENNDAFCFITSKVRTIEQAVKIVEDFPYIACLFHGDNPTEEQFKKLWKHSARWIFPRFLEKVEPSLKELYKSRMSKEEIDDVKKNWC